MQKCEEFEINFPEWAVVAHFNSDISGMDDEDIKLLTQWEEEMNKVCKEKDCVSWILDVDFDNETHFTNYPEFGLPCGCYNAKVVFFKP